MASDDFCVVCADAMDWTGYGPCGHKEACSRCVARLRFVLDDKKCVICREESPEVFFTRFSGDYTARLGPEQFKQLKDRAKRGELQQLPEVDGYFDDPDHYAYIKKLCSYTHPVLARSADDSPAFNSLSALKRKVAEVSKLNFCDLCLTGRKVFISEQVLYTKPDLERHMRTGDDAGPLAESGFGGHPNCRFCRRRFYDSSELYKHMESRHEHCFLCRRQRPDKYVYFRDYDELDEHFRNDHHMCPHPACLEKKFVVFAQEAELKRHIATEHGDEMNMSRAQRRQALTIPIDVQYTRGLEGRNADLPASRPGIVIGGGGAGSIGPNPNARGRGGGRGPGMRHSRSDTGLAAAVAASIESSQAEASQRAAASAAASEEPRLASVTFSAEDFPSVSGAGRGGTGGVTAPLGTWVGAPGTSGSSVSAEHFPALPSLSRSQKKRAKELSAAQTLAARMGVGARTGPPRVLNRAVPGLAPAMPTPGAGSSTGASTSSGSGANDPRGAGAGPSNGVRHVHSTPSLGGPADDEDSLDGDLERLQLQQPPLAEGASIVDDFPSLPSGPVAAAHPSWMPVKSRAPKPRAHAAAGGGSSAAPSAASATAAGPGMPAPRADDFPTLAAAMPASAAAAAAPRKARGRPSSANTGGIRVVNAAAPAPAPPVPVPSAAEAVAAAGGVSESLKAANRGLIDKIKRQLDEAGFASFRAQSAGFMHGDVSAAAYHKDVVGLGLLPLVPELAALCPDPQRRFALMAAHRAFLESDRAHDMQALGASWVPPEAGLAAANRAEAESSWTCVRCTLLNAPQAGSCEVCGAAKPKPGAPVYDGAGVASSSGAAAASSSGAAAKGKSKSAAAATSSPWGPAANGTGSAEPGATSRPASAAASGASTRSSGGSSSANGASRPQSSADVAASSDFPALPGNSSRAAVNASSIQGQQQQQQQQQQAGKKKKPEKQSLQALLASGAVHPGNAWTQNRSAGPSATAGLGQWGKGGGKKLAKQAKDLGFAAT